MWVVVADVWAVAGIDGVTHRQVEDSESAYSEVKGQLEQAWREKSSFHEQGEAAMCDLCVGVCVGVSVSVMCVDTLSSVAVESHHRELEVLREDLQATKRALSHVDSEHALTKEVGHSLSPLCLVCPSAWVYCSSLCVCVLYVTLLWFAGVR